MQVRHTPLPTGLVIAAVAVALLLLFPPVHVHPLSGSTARDSADRALRAARATADDYWNQTLLTAPPMDIKALLAPSQQAAAVASKGHSADVGGASAYLLTGRARIISADDQGLWLDVDAPGDMHVLLLTGPIFGNALRDATGALPMGRMSFTQFNSVSDELNHLSEAQARRSLPANIPVGTRIEFRAAGEVDNSGVSPVLELAPIQVRLL